MRFDRTTSEFLGLGIVQTVSKATRIAFERMAREDRRPCIVSLNPDAWQDLADGLMFLGRSDFRFDIRERQSDILWAAAGCTIRVVADPAAPLGRIEVT